MTAKLSEELVVELERAGDQPLRVENPRNHKLYVIVAEERFSKGVVEQASDSAWTEELNARRFQLIDKEIDGTISSAEETELHQLQRQVDEYMRRMAPLPLAAARDLHEQLRRSLNGNTTAPDA